MNHEDTPRPGAGRRRRGRAVAAAGLLVAGVAAAACVTHRDAGRSMAPAATSPAMRVSPMPPEPTMPAAPSLFAPTWFVSAQVGWDATNGSLEKTTDGGAHWAAQLSLGYPKLYARDMRFLDAQTGFVMPLVTVSGHGASALYATTDGEHWVRRTMPVTANPASGMDFVSASEGYVLLDTGAPQTPAVFHTVDGGNTWQQVAVAAAPDATPVSGQLPSNVHLEGMRFVDAAHGWIAATGLTGPSAAGLSTATPSYFATSDGGHTWHEQVLPVPAGVTYPDPSDHLEPPHFTDPLHGFAAFLTQQPPGARRAAGKFGSQAMVFDRTSDGGRTWAASGVSPGGALTGAILNQSDLLVLTDTDAYASRDRGATWQHLSALPSRGSWVDFATPRNGFAGDPGSSALLITDDGGRTWRSA